MIAVLLATSVAALTFVVGSVTAEHIAAAIKAQSDVDIDRRDVRLDEPIRSIGTHEVKIHLFTDVEPIITVEVEPEG